MPVVKATRENIARAAEALKAGRLVAFPTETVYGLGADATNARAVAEVFAVKGRPTFNPLIVHVADQARAEAFAVFTEKARRLAGAFWPGPLTLVLARRPGSTLADLATAGLDTVAVRVPDHPVARALLEAAAIPLAAPSANRSGHLSPTRAEHVLADLDEAPAFILDAGPTAHGIESTVLDATGNRVFLLRPGAVPADAVEAVLSEPLARGEQADGGPRSPGQLASHYAPVTPLRLNARFAAPDEALLAFGEAPPHEGPVINLSPARDLVEAAANLFAALRTLDQARARAIAVMPIPETGLGEAINDRLRRAAHPSAKD